MTHKEATKAFEENRYFIETLTSKYRTYPNYEDVLQQAYLTAWEALLRYDEDNNTKITTWLQCNVTPALRGYAIKEMYNGVFKYNSCRGMKKCIIPIVHF